MMLAWLGEQDKAQKLNESVGDVIKEGRVRTYDMGGTSKTLEMAEAIAEKL
jgi:isocitrate/isopropylmalate dehydrogenase